MYYPCFTLAPSVHHPYIIHTSIFFTVLLFYLQPHCYGIDTGSEPGCHHECIINIICALSMSYTYIGHVSSMHHQLSMVHPCNFDGMMMMVIEPTKKNIKNSWIMINYLWWSCMNNEWFMIRKSSSSLIIIHNSLMIYDSWIMSDDDSFMNNEWSMSDYYAHTWMNHDWL